MILMKLSRHWTQVTVGSLDDPAPGLVELVHSRLTSEQRWDLHFEIEEAMAAAQAEIDSHRPPVATGDSVDQTLELFASKFKEAVGVARLHNIGRLGERLDLDESPLIEHRKTTSLYLQWMDHPFVVQTGEGTSYVIDSSTDGWEDGYFRGFPAGGSPPFPVSPKYARDNYAPAERTI